MARKHFDNVRHLITSSGVGEITFGSVPTSWRSFAAAGAVAGDQPGYTIQDGDAIELGYLTLGSGALTATRTVIYSSNSNNPLDLSGSAILECTPLASMINDDVVSFVRAQSASSGEKAQARSNLGMTTTGQALATAMNAADARDTIGATTTGSALIMAADAAAARTAAGATTTGSALFTAADAAAARVAVGVVGAVKVRTFSASGTYTPDAHLLFAMIECVGGGGGGGGCGPQVGSAGGGSGGGYGSYSRKFVTAADIGSSKAVSIGSAGAGVNGANGTDGGDTSVGTLCIAKGGKGGLSPALGGATLGGGAGGISGTGDIAVPGANGAPSIGSTGSTSLIATSGAGASGPFGAGGQAAASYNGGSAGGNASGYGAGGGGSTNHNTAGSIGGGAGSGGFVVITEYCSQ